MAREVSKKQLDIYEAHTDDGGVGLVIGGVLHMGYDEGDLMRLLAQVFPTGDSIDGDLYDLAQTYLDADAAKDRAERLGRL